MTNLPELIGKLTELEKKAQALEETEGSAKIYSAECMDAWHSFNKSLSEAAPTFLTALREAIDLIETLEKVFEKYPMYARMAEGKMEPIGNPCTEFLKKWTTEEKEPG